MYFTFPAVKLVWIDLTSKQSFYRLLAFVRGFARVNVVFINSQVIFLSLGSKPFFLMNVFMSLVEFQTKRKCKRQGNKLTNIIMYVT